MTCSASVLRQWSGLVQGQVTPVSDIGASVDDADEELPDYESDADTLDGLRARIAQLEDEKKLIRQVRCSAPPASCCVGQVTDPGG